MHSNGRNSQDAEAILDRRRMQALGVLLPIRLEALSVFPGRHPLGRAGEGMRFLRTRPYEPGEDNPRNIDKFSPEGEYWINEWEAEGQATVRILGDISASMAFTPKVAVRNLALLQLNYSLWRACDRVRTVLYSRDSQEEFAGRNLRNQLKNLAQFLGGNPAEAGRDVFEVLRLYETGSGRKKDNLIFLVSDFSALEEAQENASAQDWRYVLRRLPCDLIPVIISFRLNRELTGSVKLWDPERQTQKLTLLMPSRIDHINEREQRRVLKLERLFRSLGLNYLIFRDERDVYPELARLAKIRKRRKL